MQRALRFVPLRATLLALLLNAPRLMAQSSPSVAAGHHGFHMALGQSVSSNGITCEGGCTNLGPKFDRGALLQFGAAIRPNLVLSGEANGARHYGWYSAVLQYYPQVSKGFFMKGGVGLAYLEAETASRQAISSFNVGAVAGLGYDLHVKRGFWVTPYVDAMYAPKADAALTGSGVLNRVYRLGGDLINAGLAVSYHR